MHVLNRLLQGDVLYRDVYFGATPLSVLVSFPFAAALGPQLVVIRFLAATLFFCTGCLGLALLRGIGIAQPAAKWAFVLAMCGYGHPSAVLPLYNPLCYLLLLIVLAAALRVVRYPSARASLIAGVGAGLCFAAKQNLGGYVLVALLATLACLPERARNGSWALAGFAASAAASMLPFALRAGAAALWENMAGNKAGYLQLVRVNYWEGLRGWFEFAAVAGSRSLAEASNLYWRALFLLPALSAILLLYSWLARKHERRELIAISAFFVAACLGLFPLGDEAHTLLVTPIALIVTLKYCPRPSRQYLRSWGTVALLLWLGLGPLYWLAASWQRYANGRATFCQIAGLRGALIDSGQIGEIERTTEMLVRAAPADGKVLIISPYAGLYYATTGLRNPTPYDYPLANVFTARAKARLQQTISLGGIRTVAVDRRAFQQPFFIDLHPAWLEDAALARLECRAGFGGWLLCGSPERGT
ncbi:MAG: hypothetical protein HY821_24590 [Acidobacteria bacterium]|nr:hypothetical protein [Acidobacteriota bacterium]